MTAVATPPDVRRHILDVAHPLLLRKGFTAAQQGFYDSADALRELVTAPVLAPAREGLAVQGGLSLRTLGPVVLPPLWAAACLALCARRRDLASATWIWSSLIFLSSSASSALSAAWRSSSSLRRVSRRALSADEPPWLLEPSPAPVAPLAAAALAAASNRPGPLSSTLRLTTPMDARSAMRRVTLLLLRSAGCSSSFAALLCLMFLIC